MDVKPDNHQVILCGILARHLPGRATCAVKPYSDMECRIGCAACCIAPSISSPIPGMERGKPAGERCAQLTEDNLCRIFGRDERPPVCSSLQPSLEMCGFSSTEAFQRLTEWELATQPIFSDPPHSLT